MRTPDSTIDRQALARGAGEIQCLLRCLREAANAACAECLDDDDVADPRDYRALPQVLETSLAENLGHSAPAHREGYLCALTHLMSMVADGSVPAHDWNPINATEAAFAAPAPAQVQAAVERLQTA